MQRGGDPKCPQGRANGRGNSGPGRGVVAERSQARGDPMQRRKSEFQSRGRAGGDTTDGEPPPPALTQPCSCVNRGGCL